MSGLLVKNPYFVKPPYSVKEHYLEPLYHKLLKHIGYKNFILYNFFFYNVRPSYYYSWVNIEDQKLMQCLIINLLQNNIPNEIIGFIIKQIIILTNLKFSSGVIKRVLGKALSKQKIDNKII